MRYTDLDLRDLLDFRPEGGVIRFAEQRVLLMDASALGILRRELIDRFGVTVARGVLTRFGFVHGWNTAQSLKSALPWDSERDWQVAGGRLQMLQGQVVFESVPGERGRGAEGNTGGTAGKNPSPRRFGASRTRPSSTGCTSESRTSPYAGP